MYGATIRGTFVALVVIACGDGGIPSPPDGGTDFDQSLEAGASEASIPDSDSGGGRVLSGQWVTGYHVGYYINEYPLASIDWAALTHMVFGPLTLKADLSLDVSFLDENGTGSQDAVALARAAHAHGVKALLMVGGENAWANIAQAATSANRGALVDALVNAMTTLGYDGIDLDWEDLDMDHQVDLDDLVALARALRTARPDMVLTYPAMPINGNYQTVDPRMVTLADLVDQFNVQTYFPTTAGIDDGWSSSFVAPLSGASKATPVAIDDTLQRYANAGIAKSKLGMGLAFYALCYTGGITGPRQKTDATHAFAGGDNRYPLSDFFASGSTFDLSGSDDRKYDAIAAEPYLTRATPFKDAHCANTQYISYEDEVSIAAKGAFSRSNGYGGVIVWNLAEGWLPPGASGGRARNALTQALKVAFLDP